MTYELLLYNRLFMSISVNIHNALRIMHYELIV